MSSHHPTRVLSINDDERVRSARNLILSKDSYELVSIDSQQPLKVSEIRAFDMAIVGDSLPAHRAMAIIDRLHRYNPDLRILRPVTESSASSTSDPAPPRKAPASDHPVQRESLYFA